MCLCTEHRLNGRFHFGRSLFAQVCVTVQRPVVSLATRTGDMMMCVAASGVTHVMQILERHVRTVMDQRHYKNVRVVRLGFLNSPSQTRMSANKKMRVEHTRDIDDHTLAGQDSRPVSVLETRIRRHARANLVHAGVALRDAGNRSGADSESASISFFEPEMATQLAISIAAVGDNRADAENLPSLLPKGAKGGKRMAKWLKRVCLSADCTPGADIDAKLRAHFKHWIDVRHGEYRAYLERNIKLEDPSLTGSALERQINERVRADQNRRRNAYEQTVPDKKMCDLLLREYVQYGDTSAGEIYRVFMARRARLRYPSDQAGYEAELDKEESVIDDFVHAEKNRRVFVKRSSKFDRVIRNPELVTGKAINSRIRSLAETLPGALPTGHGNDQTRTVDEIMQDHKSRVAEGVMRSLGAAMKMVGIAPRDDIFYAPSKESPSTGHCVSDLHRRVIDALSLAPPTDSCTEDQLERQQAAAVDSVRRYLKAWERVGNETQTDFDRALIRKSDANEERMLREALPEELMSAAQLQLDRSFGRDPKKSHMIRVLIALTEDEEFSRRFASELEFANMPTGDKARETLDAELNEQMLECETCPRAYLIGFLREPSPRNHGERSCIKGASCIGQTLKTVFLTTNAARDSEGGKAGGFTLREFLLQREQREYERTGKLPLEIKLCLLCERFRVTRASVLLQSHEPGVSRITPQVMLSTHSVRVDEPGEYDGRVALSVTIKTNQFTGIVLPTVHFSSAHYHRGTILVDGQHLRTYVESDAMLFRPCSSSETTI